MRKLIQLTNFSQSILIQVTIFSPNNLLVYGKLNPNISQKFTENKHSSSNELDDESMQPNADTKKLTIDEELKNLPTLRFKPTLMSPIRASTRVTTPQEYNPLFGSTRHIELSNSNKHATEVPKLGTGKEIFKTTFKIPDGKTLKAVAAKKDPITDPYHDPTPNNFRAISQQNIRREPFLVNFLLSNLIL